MNQYVTCCSIWVLLPLVISHTSFGVNKSGRRGDVSVSGPPPPPSPWQQPRIVMMGSGRGGHAKLRQVLLGFAHRPWDRWQDGSWENTYAAPPLFSMYSAILLFEIRNLINAGNQLNVAMVHHSGSIQSFKQQKGWSLMWLFRVQ